MVLRFVYVDDVGPYAVGLDKSRLVSEALCAGMSQGGHPGFRSGARVIDYFGNYVKIRVIWRAPARKLR